MLVSLAILVMLAVQLWPGSEGLLFSEDGVIEDASAAAYAIAALTGFIALYRGLLEGKSNADRSILIGVPVLGMICALDEISWGARIFKWHMPGMRGGGEFDGAHDIFILLERLLQTLDPVNRAVIFVCAMSLLVAASYCKRKKLISYFGWLIDDHVRRCLCAAVALLALAVFLDFGHGRYISSLEEFSELSASLFLAVAGSSSMMRSHKRIGNVGKAAETT